MQKRGTWVMESENCAAVHSVHAYIRSLSDVKPILSSSREARQSLMTFQGHEQRLSRINDFEKFTTSQRGNSQEQCGIRFDSRMLQSSPCCVRVFSRQKKLAFNCRKRSSKVLLNFQTLSNASKPSLMDTGDCKMQNI